MQYGICPLSTVPVRISPEESSEMLSQLLFGGHFKVLESRKYWSKIRIAFDKTEGWILNRQLAFVTNEEYDQIDNESNSYTADLISYVENENQLQDGKRFKPNEARGSGGCCRI